MKGTLGSNPAGSHSNLSVGGGMHSVHLTHWARNKTVAIVHTTVLNAFELERNVVYTNSNVTSDFLYSIITFSYTKYVLHSCTLDVVFTLSY